MFSILSSITAVFGAVKQLFSWLSQGRLIRAGEDKAVRRGLEKTLENKIKTDRARADVKHNPDSVRDDPANRD